ncbi:ABC transporter substrate-binding protein (plasmid) [Sinorhizobium fredii NGR234]|uniref:ABC transporter substrate-binding protein n=1 Tax=Sinorhizobium fredii (strain NBRC 101917 / NGR234) TaxID=394 RepID=Q6W206_SINFN|nr:ABC transporter substrate-binding protein [Sinorhizobium fredii]AAQ87212.1 Spermidine/putrescine-binding protein [Sinorhizobium fredii NGR234]ACP23109.1 ABC transporter substrate-binding protein [Sinorhizobium fredii NGR234]
MQKVKNRAIGAVSMLALVATTAIATNVRAEDKLTIASWGGAYQDSQAKAYFDPFSQETGTKIVTDEWSGETAKLKGMVETGNVSWDVVDVEPGHALQGCDEGWLEPIDYESLGGKDKFLPGAALECAIGNVAFAYILAYDNAKFPNGGPTKVADIWDVKKFPGPRSLRKSPKSTLELALLADGVAPDDIYKVLETSEGVDRAFKKLDEIKPHVKVWWGAGAQPPQLLADGEVAVTTAYNGRIYDAVKNSGKDFKIVWDGAALDWDMWAIPKGSPRVELAKKFVAFASRPENLAQQTKYIPYGPSNIEAAGFVDASVLPNLPTSPENSKTSFSISAQFWADHDEELTERFNTWLAQ